MTSRNYRAFETEGIVLRSSIQTWQVWGLFTVFGSIKYTFKKKKNSRPLVHQSQEHRTKYPSQKDHVFVQLYVLFNISQYIYNYSKSKTVKLCSTECYSPEMLFKNKQKGYNCQTNFRNTAHHFSFSEVIKENHITLILPLTEITSFKITHPTTAPNINRSGLLQRASDVKDTWFYKCLRSREIKKLAYSKGSNPNADNKILFPLQQVVSNSLQLL